MTLIKVELEKCNRDGICADACPAQLLELTDDGPRPIEGAEALCIECGHCVAICPQAAISAGGIAPGDCAPLMRDWLLDEAQAAHFLRARRSIRVYRKEPLSRERLAALIEVARHAPSGHNWQPVNWLVIHDHERMPALAGLVADWMRDVMITQPALAAMLHLDRVLKAWESGTDRILRGAPHLIVAHAPKADRSAPQACTIALTYLELAASAFGLGACWAGYFNTAALFWKPLADALELPEGHIPNGSMIVGHPKYRYHRLPPRKPAPITWC